MSVLPPPPGEGDDGQARPESHPVHHVPPGGPDLPPLPAGIIIPDDLSELDEEIAGVRRELRHTRRMARLRALPGVRRVPAHGLPGTLVVLSLFAIALLGTLLMAFPPGRGSPRPTARPLASPVEKVGTQGGLLPRVDLVDGAGRQTPARALRPAVLAVVPPGCACADQLRGVSSQAHEFGLSTYFIEPRAVPAQGVSVSQLSRQTGLSGFVDPDGRVMALAPKPDKVELLLVSPDGRLASPPLAYSLGERLEQPLAGVAK
jgi:hypothetical protein